MSDARRQDKLPEPLRPGLPTRALLAAVAVGLLARLAFGFLYWTDQPLTRDEQEYLSLSRSLAAGHGFTYDAAMRAGAIEPFGRAPGYPVFLALIGGGRDVPSSVPTSVKAAQAAVGGIGVWMVGILAYRLAGRRAAVWAAAIAAVYPPLVWIAGYALSEGLFWPIGLLVAWWFDRAMTTPRPLKWAVSCGALIGLGILIRPALVFFVPLAVLLLLTRRQILPLAGLVLGVVLVVSPWTWRNYQHHGRLMFVASEGGVTFWTGNHPLAIGDGDLAANLPIKLDDQRFRAEHPGLNEEQLEPLYYREALAWMRAHPLEWIQLEFRKLFYLVVPVGPSYTLHSMRYYALSVLSYVSVLILALGALGRVRLGATPGLWLLAGSAVLVALVFFPQERFRIPILDPTLVILAGSALASFIRPSARA